MKSKLDLIFPVFGIELVITPVGFLYRSVFAACIPDQWSRVVNRYLMLPNQRTEVIFKQMTLLQNFYIEEIQRVPPFLRGDGKHPPTGVVLNSCVIFL